MIEQCILVQFSVSWGVGPDSGKQQVWVGLLDITNQRITETRQGDLDTLIQLSNEHPGVFIYSMGNLPTSIEMAYQDYKARQDKIQKDLTKGW